MTHGNESGVGGPGYLGGHCGHSHGDDEVFGLFWIFFGYVTGQTVLGLHPDAEIGRYPGGASDWMDCPVAPQPYGTGHGQTWNASSYMLALYLGSPAYAAYQAAKEKADASLAAYNEAAREEKKAQAAHTVLRGLLLSPDASMRFGATSGIEPAADRLATATRALTDAATRLGEDLAQANRLRQAAGLPGMLMLVSLGTEATISER